MGEEKQEKQVDSFAFFRSYRDTAKELPEDQELLFYRMVTDYIFDDIEPNKEDGFVINSLFQSTKKNMDISKKRSKAGRGGGEKSPKTKELDPKLAMIESPLDGVKHKAPISKVDAALVDKVPYEEIKKAYNEICTELTTVRSIQGKRQKLTGAIFRKYGLETMVEAFRLTSDDDFLCGRVKDWKADFDWLMIEGNFIKVLEGKYKQHRRNDNGQQFQHQEVRDPRHNPF